MITKWRLSRFKSIDDQSVSLGPLTLISGVNSSGKSTLLQSMGVVAQTLANQLERRSLLLNGHVMSLGSFEDVCARGCDDFLIGWELVPGEPPPPVADDDALEVDLYATRQDVELTSISAEVTFDNRGNDGIEVVAGFLAVAPVTDPPAECRWQREMPPIGASELLATWEFTPDTRSLDEVSKRYPQTSALKTELRHFLPSRLSLEVSRADMDADFRTQVLSLIRRPYAVEQHPLLADSLPVATRDLLVTALGAPGNETCPPEDATYVDWIAWLNERRGTFGPTLSEPQFQSQLRQTLTPTSGSVLTIEHTNLPGRLPDAVVYAETFFATKFRYLGPLRDEPRSVYPHPTKLDPIDLGRRGEFTAAVYHAYKDEAVHHAYMDQVEEFGPIARTRFAALSVAVDEWLRYLHVADHVRSQEGRHGHVLSVGIGEDDDWDVVHVGTGISQVLPILVLGLLAQPDDSLLIEHPELHLHPSVQTRLADFFLFLAVTGRQVIVETHSEHIINRARYRIAADPEDLVRGIVRTIFADTKDGKTAFTSVNISEYGAIDSWPQGFFDEGSTEAERIVHAALLREERSRE